MSRITARSVGPVSYGVMPLNTVLAVEIALFELTSHEFLLDFKYNYLMESALVFNLSLIFYILK